jgi:hypothetical protein
MRNLFAKPATLNQLIIGSLCWVGSCLVAFSGIIDMTNILLPRGDVGAYPIFGSAILICGLMWNQVIASGWQVLWSEETSVVKLLTGIWLFLLTVLLVISGLLIVLGICIVIA